MSLLLRKDGLTGQRDIADDAAKFLLERADKEGHKISDAEMLSVLRKWAFKKNDTRQNVLPDGTEFVHSDTFGLIRSRTGAFMATGQTLEHPNFTRLVCRWGKDHKPDEFSIDFPFTSINVNSGYAARLHRDANNQGPSMIKALGDFTGGTLNYWPEDTAELSLEDLSRMPHDDVDLKKGWMLFDGCRGHEVNKFEGERFSVVFFSSNNFWKVPQDVVEELKEVGINYPTQENFKIIQSYLTAPKGYDLDGGSFRSLTCMFGGKEKEKARHFLDGPEHFAREEEAKKRVDAMEQEQKEAERERLDAQMKEFELAAQERQKQREAEEKAQREARPERQERKERPERQAREEKHGLKGLGKFSESFLKKSKLQRPSKPATLKAAGSGEGVGATSPKHAKRPATSAPDAPTPPKAKRPFSAETASFTPLAADLASCDFQPGDGAAAGKAQDFSAFAAVLEATIGGAPAGVVLTNYFCLLLQGSAAPAESLTAALELLLPLAPLPEAALVAAISKSRPSSAQAKLSLHDVASKRSAALADIADGAGMEQAGRRLEELLAACSAMGREAFYLARVLRGKQTVARHVVLRSFARAFASTAPGDGGKARVWASAAAEEAAAAACERAVALAIGEESGSPQGAVQALLGGAPPAALGAICGPSCGRPLLPMRAVTAPSVHEAMWRMEGSSFIVEPRYRGERVQIHKEAKGRITVFGANSENINARFEEGFLARFRVAIGASSCVLDAVLQGQGESARLVAFDCLFFNGDSLTRRSLSERREALKRAVFETKEICLACATEISFKGLTAATAAAVQDPAGTQAARVILKGLGGVYEAGCTSGAWLEVA